jgi:hypothetical protein
LWIIESYLAIVIILKIYKFMGEEGRKKRKWKTWVSISRPST